MITSVFSLKVCRICVFAAVFHVMLVVDIFSKLGTWEEDFFLTRILTACTSG